ncbi:hypothetical protein SteCoe_32748 [Stentor coeruleus]|uniref:Uncharacterized protein n=1 Tax=Stentor coeruleus TaxID=5963 RepID=A0A1R2AYC3_9CILI|nr:hypothetical protein SteCoe_32748 [Stentor coeruleus]
MLNFVGKSFRPTHINTIGIDKEQRDFDYEGKIVPVVVWDTAGQEKYRGALPKQLFKRIHGVLLVYDINNHSTFNSVSSWMELIKADAPEDTAIVLVANKIDLEYRVSESEGRDLSKLYRIPFIMTSAKEGLNIEVAFRELMKAVLTKNPGILSTLKSSTIDLDDKPRDNKNCCSRG